MAKHGPGKRSKKWKIAIGVTVVGVLVALTGWLVYDKQGFVNPDQQDLTLSPADKATDIRIQEWNVSIPVSGQGAYYIMNPDGTVYITTIGLESLRSQIQGCKSGLRGVTIDRNLKEVGVIEAMCMPTESQAAQKIRVIQEGIRTALRTPATL